MKTIIGSILFLVTVSATPLSPQTANDADAHLLNLVKELTVKQSQIADNQGKTETKVTDLAEAIRMARLQMSRGGGPHIPPKPGTNVPAQKPPPPKP